VSSDNPNIDAAANDLLAQAASLGAAKRVLGSSDSLEAALSLLTEAIAVAEAKSIADKVVVQRVFFASGSSALSREYKAELSKFAKSLKAEGDTAITVTGYADSKAPKGNKELSLKRANEAASYLRSLGVKVSVKTLGLGTTSPLKGNSESTARRVDITIQT
jgi:outer membrane protein OmpA-like peptidoglycan-associated protein